MTKAKAELKEAKKSAEGYRQKSYENGEKLRKVESNIKALQAQEISATQDKQDKIEELQQQLGTMSEQKESYQTEAAAKISASESKVEELQKLLGKAVQEHQDSVSGLQTQLEEQEAAIETQKNELHSQINQLKEQIQSLQEQLSSVTSENEALRSEQIKTVDFERKEAAPKVACAKSSGALSTLQNKSEDAVFTTSTDRERSESVPASARVTNEFIAVRQMKSKESRTEIAHLQGQLREKENKLQAREEQLTHLTTTLGVQHSKSEELDSELAVTKEKLTKEIESKAQLAKEFDAEKIQTTATKKKAVKLEKQLNKTKDSLKSAQDKAKEQAKVDKAARKELEAEVTKLKAQVSALAEKAGEDPEEFVVPSRAGKLWGAATSAAVSIRESRSKDIRRTEELNRDLASKNETLAANNKTLNATIDQLRKNVATLTEQLKAQQSSPNSLDVDDGINLLDDESDDDMDLLADAQVDSIPDTQVDSVPDAQSEETEKYQLIQAQDANPSWSYTAAQRAKASAEGGLSPRGAANLQRSSVDANSEKASTIKHTRTMSSL